LLIITIAGLVVAWSAIIGIVLQTALQSTKDEVRHLIDLQADSRYFASETLRRWVAKHGGVYVPVSEHLKPNPLLANLPERDINTPSGKQLTRLNAFAVLRSVMDDFASDSGSRIRITSTEPLRPENAADPWEQHALSALSANGVKKIAEHAPLDGEPFWRVLYPIRIKKPCLNCHLYEGMKLGDVAGGLGVNLRMAPFDELRRHLDNSLWLSYGAAWITGLLAITVLGFFWLRHTRELLAYQKKLEHLATKDPLTGLLNRSELETRLLLELKRADRYNGPPSIIMLDLDHFKKINDNYGHTTGDRVLIQVAACIVATVREVDTVARYGGEEILVVLPATSREKARLTAERIRQGISELEIRSDTGEPIKVTASFGIATEWRKGLTMDEMVRAADAALYQAKEAGRNCVVSASQGLPEEA
jgi:diguanylate cyclase (GGDEF)-like protein